MLKVNNQVLEVKKEKSVESSAPKGAPVYVFLTKEPFNLNKSRAQVLYRMSGKNEVRLLEVAGWWKRNYCDQERPGDAFALIYSALKEDWDVTDCPYCEWSKKKSEAVTRREYEDIEWVFLLIKEENLFSELSPEDQEEAHVAFAKYEQDIRDEKIVQSIVICEKCGGEWRGFTRMDSGEYWFICRDCDHHEATGPLDHENGVSA